MQTKIFHRRWWKPPHYYRVSTKNMFRSFGNNFHMFVFQRLLLSFACQNVSELKCQRFTSRVNNNKLNYKYRNSQLRPDATTVCLVDSLSENTYCTMKWQLILYFCWQISHKGTSGKAIPWNQETSIKT